MNTPMIEVKSSGAAPPAAMKVAPATSGVISSCREINENVVEHKIQSFWEILYKNYHKCLEFETMSSHWDKHNYIHEMHCGYTRRKTKLACWLKELVQCYVIRQWINFKKSISSQESKSLLSDVRSLVLHNCFFCCGYKVNHHNASI